MFREGEREIGRLSRYVCVCEKGLVCIREREREREKVSDREKVNEREREREGDLVAMCL